MPNTKPFSALRAEVEARPGTAERLAHLRDERERAAPAPEDDDEPRPLGAYDGPYRMDDDFCEADAEIAELFHAAADGAD